MPIYVYRCDHCDANTEKRQSFSDAPLTTCETCGSPIRRVVQPVGVIFKGSGFYSTDHRAAANGKKADGADGESSEAPAKAEGAAETKGDAKGEAKADPQGATKGDSKADGKGEAKPAKGSETKAAGTSTPAAPKAEPAASKAKSD